MKLAEIKIEVEFSVYQIKPTNKKWYEFWKPKSKKVLMSSDYDKADDMVEEATK